MKDHDPLRPSTVYDTSLVIPFTITLPQSKPYKQYSYSTLPFVHESHLTHLAKIHFANSWPAD